MLLTVLRMNQISSLEQATYVKFCIFAYLGQLFVPLDQFLQFQYPRLQIGIFVPGKKIHLPGTKVSPQVVCRR